jgi:hypothetical protein
VWIGSLSLPLERPRRDFDEVAVVHVPAAFLRQVRNDPVGDVVRPVGLERRRELFCRYRL